MLGYCTDRILMLDADKQIEEVVVEFAKRYAIFHDLGSVLAMKSSDEDQVDLFGNKLANYSIVFGKCPLSWEEIKWHVTEARRLEMVERSFLALRKFGYITIRANAKNRKIPPPRIVAYYDNGDRTGIDFYLAFWKMCKELGRKKKSRSTKVVSNAR